MDVPPIRYAHTSDGVNIAYWMAGNGPPLLWAWQAGFSHIELMCAVPTVPEMLERLMEDRTVVAWDLRNTGLSQRGCPNAVAGDAVRDLAAVVARCEGPVAIAGYQHHAVPMAQFAIDHPELVSQLIFVAPWRGGGPPDGFVGPGTDSIHSIRPLDLRLFCESWANAIVGRDDPSMVAPLARLMEGSMLGSEAGTTAPWDGDLFALLPEVNVPVLVIHPRKHPWIADSQKVAALCPNGRLVMLELPTMLPGGRSTGEIVCNFLEETSNHRIADSAKGVALRTVLFTDLEGHTRMMDRLGDAKGREVLRQHERITRECLQRHEGTEVKTLGDSFMCWFSSASAAVECAIAIQRAFSETDVAGERLAVRVGINAGEPIAEEGDLWGSSVIAAERVKSSGRGGQVMVSDVVRQLVAGKGFLFSDTGNHVLKGFEEPMRIWELRWSHD